MATVKRYRYGLSAVVLAAVLVASISWAAPSTASAHNQDAVVHVLTECTGLATSQVTYWIHGLGACPGSVPALWSVVDNENALSNGFVVESRWRELSGDWRVRAVTSDVSARGLLNVRIGLSDGRVLVFSGGTVGESGRGSGWYTYPFQVLPDGVEVSVTVTTDYTPPPCTDDCTITPGAAWDAFYAGLFGGVFAFLAFMGSVWPLVIVVSLSLGALAFLMSRRW